MALKQAKTEAGFWLSQPPVALFHASDRDGFQNFLHQALNAPTAVIPTPPRNSFPVPKDLGLPFERGWQALDNRYEKITVFSEGESYTVNAYLRDGHADSERCAAFTGPHAFDHTVDDVFSRMNSQQQEA